MLEVFFAQKAERMRELGVGDVFGAPGVHEFIVEATTANLAQKRPAIELYALSAGETIVATFSGTVAGSASAACSIR